MFESHPLSIFSAPPDISCITSIPPGISLGARAIGDWSTALNLFANKGVSELRAVSQDKYADNPLELVEVPIQVMLDGPYGGCSVDMGVYETALLIAGGAGVTFTLGLLDDIVGRCVRQRRKNGERTRRIEFVWCVRSFGECCLNHSSLVFLIKTFSFRFNRLIRACTYGYSSCCSFFVDVRSPAGSPHFDIRYLPL